MVSFNDANFLYGLLAALCILLAIAVSLPFFKRTRRCPKCDTVLPKFRKPRNKRQRLWGGWTCPNCGTELDRKARPVSD